MKADIASEKATANNEDGYAPPRIESLLTDRDLERETLYAGGQSLLPP